jgi:uncharacterized protein
MSDTPPEPSPLREPDPLWPDAPRYCPDIKLPPYRYVRGLNPHPERDPKGHLRTATRPQPETLHVRAWPSNRAYLYGFDLYHQGYLWEAHEAWEGLWKKAAEDSREANLLQALILNAAAQLKAHRQNAHGARRHSREARWRLVRIHEAAENGDTPYMGIRIGAVLDDMRRHYGPCWTAKDDDPLRLEGTAPRFDLVFEDA